MRVQKPGFSKSYFSIWQGEVPLSLNLQILISQCPWISHESKASLVYITIFCLELQIEIFRTVAIQLVSLGVYLSFSICRFSVCHLSSIIPGKRSTSPFLGTIFGKLSHSEPLWQPYSILISTNISRYRGSHPCFQSTENVIKNPFLHPSWFPFSASLNCPFQ